MMPRRKEEIGYHRTHEFREATAAAFTRVAAADPGIEGNKLIAVGYRNGQDVGTALNSFKDEGEAADWLVVFGILQEGFDRVALEAVLTHFKKNTNEYNSRPRVTHCKHGHEYTPENTKADRHGWRACRTCVREAKARKKAANGPG